MTIIAHAQNTIYQIVYSTESKILRRVVIAEQDWRYHFFHRLKPGESCIYAPAGNNDELPEWENHVFNATGVVPPDSRCAVVRNGVVIGFCGADPALDEASEEGGSLVLLNGRHFGIGDRYRY